MRRQVITAAVLGLTLATTSLPALADDGGFNGSVNTDGPGYDVRTDVDYHHTTGSNNNGNATPGHHHGDGGGEAIDGRSRADAEAELAEADRNQDLTCDVLLPPSPNTAIGKEWAEKCNSPATKGQKATPKPDPVLVGRHAALQLSLPGATPHIDPSPDLNRWHSAAVGQALWLSVDDPTATTQKSITFMAVSYTHL